MGKSLLPLLAGVGLAGVTGGLAAPAVGAAGGEAAMGAGLGLAGDALAAQGAAGLLGSAGAAAAGYGAPAALGIGAAGGTGAVGGLNDSAIASFGPNGEYSGNTIASELSANPYTGGYDNLNRLERIGQRVGGFLDDGGLDTLGKLKGAFNSPQQQPQAQDREISGQPVQSQPEQQGSVPFVYGQGVQLTDEQKRRLYAMQSQGLL